MNCVLCVSPLSPSNCSNIWLKEEYAFFPFLPWKNWILSLWLPLHMVLLYVIYIYCINNRTPQCETSFISIQGASNIYSTVGLTHSVEKEGPLLYLLLRCWMLPKHLKRPFTMMAMRVHRASHSSILVKERKGKRIVPDKWEAAITPDAWVYSISDKRQWHLKTGLYGIMWVFQGFLSILLIQLLQWAVFKAWTLFTNGFYKE